MKVLMRPKAIFLIVIICSFLFSSCKKDEEGPVSISGTVWISHEVNVVRKELHFLDETRVEYRSTNYYVRPIFGWVEEGPTLSSISTYTYSYPKVETQGFAEMILKMRDDMLFTEGFVYTKQ